jgi:hypothetical protein
VILVAIVSVLILGCGLLLLAVYLGLALSSP